MAQSCLPSANGWHLVVLTMDDSCQQNLSVCFSRVLGLVLIEHFGRGSLGSENPWQGWTLIDILPSPWSWPHRQSLLGITTGAIEAKMDLQIWIPEGMYHRFVCQRRQVLIPR